MCAAMTSMTRSLNASHDDLKGQINGFLRKNHPEVCRHWFDDIEPIGVDTGVLKLLVTEPIRRQYLQRSCSPQFTEAAQAVTGQLLAVQFVGESDTLTTTERNQSGTVRVHIPAEFEEQLVLSPDYTFDSFVVGPGNRLAHAAAVAVSMNLGRAYNPFFVHGGVGLGKTHLLQAISQGVIRRSPSSRVAYLSCHTFMELFLESVKLGRMREFRHRFRTVDLLVIDDVHFLSKRDQTQEEFFHTFNALYQSGKQIVLSSDASPNEIPDLEERLVSRFNSGLVTRVDRPCFETRISILRTKANLLNLTIPDEVPAYIAAKIDSNIRDLEGALSKVRGYAMAHCLEITLDSAKAALTDEIAGLKRSNQPTIQVIIDAVTAYYDIKLSDLLSKRRHKSIALPRQVCMWLARKYTRYSLEEIGGYFGGRDHTTVLHAVRTIGSRRESDPDVSQAVERIEGSFARNHSVE
ncbi:MAG: chromosomal replication initiator protein DnaA [Phycisphaerales bacterium]|nr:chromosomal replication initiator protein DnaA [Phycisphaerales bacterium]